jgi:hypothetical protein
MAQLAIRSISEAILKLDNPDDGLFRVNHILEPEYHQEKYVSICRELESVSGSVQIGCSDKLIKAPQRGIQPLYADDETDPDTLNYWGKLNDDGRVISQQESSNVCALKSISIRTGFIDFDTARCVSNEFYIKRKDKAGVQKNDVLINSTGDGTIGRVAVYNEDFPSVVDGHITICRFSDEELAWYIGAYLNSVEGQHQIFRYINGSSGQVEIYPQDIARIWIRPVSTKKVKAYAKSFKEASEQYRLFRRNMRIALSIQ